VTISLPILSRSYENRFRSVVHLRNCSLCYIRNGTQAKKLLLESFSHDCESKFIVADKNKKKIMGLMFFTNYKFAYFFTVIESFEKTVKESVIH